MKEAHTDRMANRSSPSIVELAGPAGAGKTTLAHALAQQSDNIRLCDPPYYRRTEHLPFFVANSLLLLPTIRHLWRYRDGRQLTPREMAWMVILKGWPRVLARQAPSDGKVAVLDQGPVYILAELSRFGPASLQSPSARKWWDRTIEQWATTLDMVIWLDTSDTTLLERIRTRNKWHVIKHESAVEALGFLARCRRAYGQVLSALTTKAGGPKMLRFDTALASVDEIVSQLLMAWDLRDNQGQVACRYAYGGDD